MRESEGLEDGRGGVEGWRESRNKERKRKEGGREGERIHYWSWLAVHFFHHLRSTSLMLGADIHTSLFLKARNKSIAPAGEEVCVRACARTHTHTHTQSVETLT